MVSTSSSNLSYVHNDKVNEEKGWAGNVNTHIYRDKGGMLAILASTWRPMKAARTQRSLQLANRPYYNTNRLHITWKWF